MRWADIVICGMLCHVADGIMFEFALSPCLSLAACTTADPFEITYIVYLNVKHFETQNHL